MYYYVITGNSKNKISILYKKVDLIIKILIF